MDTDKQQAFEAKLAQLRPSDRQSFLSTSYDACLRFLWWVCCCFCFATNPNKPETKEPWSVTPLDGHVARPAHLKISTSDNRAVGMKPILLALHSLQIPICAQILMISVPMQRSRLSMQSIQACLLSCMKLMSSCFSSKTWRQCQTTSIMTCGRLRVYIPQRSLLHPFPAPQLPSWHDLEAVTGHQHNLHAARLQPQRYDQSRRLPPCPTA